MIDYICSKVDTYDLYASNIKKDIIITKIKSWLYKKILL